MEGDGGLVVVVLLVAGDELLHGLRVASADGLDDVVGAGEHPVAVVDGDRAQVLDEVLADPAGVSASAPRRILSAPVVRRDPDATFTEDSSLTAVARPPDDLGHDR